MTHPAGQRDTGKKLVRSWPEITRLAREKKLRQDLESLIVTMGRRAENGRRLILHLYEHPAVSIQQVMALLGIQFNPARNLIATLEKMGILKEITGHKRNRIFLFEPYFNIFADTESEMQ